MRMQLLCVAFFAFSSLSGIASAADVTGTWEKKGRSGAGLWLLTQQDGATVRFQLELSRGAPSYNSGWIEGEFTLDGTTGVFRSSESASCTIKFKFRKSSVELQEPDDAWQTCGFGYNVHADGVLTLKSRKRPRFASSDPRFGGN
jgi:hypothetical protein